MVQEMKLWVHTRERLAEDEGSNGNDKDNCCSPSNRLNVVEVDGLVAGATVGLGIKRLLIQNRTFIGFGLLLKIALSDEFLKNILTLRCIVPVCRCKREARDVATLSVEFVIGALLGNLALCVESHDMVCEWKTFGYIRSINTNLLSKEGRLIYQTRMQ